MYKKRIFVIMASGILFTLATNDVNACLCICNSKGRNVEYGVGYQSANACVAACRADGNTFVSCK